MGARAIPAGALRRAAAALALALALALVLASAASAKPIGGGTITVGRGAAGITLGISRAAVIRKLGRPLMENSNGVMSYGRDPVIFDLYRKFTASVQQIVIAGGTFRLSDGNRIFATGGLRRLANRYGARLKFHTFGDGSPYYELVSRLHGRRVLTDFPTDRAALSGRVLDVFILFG